MSFSQIERGTLLIDKKLYQIKPLQIIPYEFLSVKQCMVYDKNENSVKHNNITLNYKGETIVVNSNYNSY